MDPISATAGAAALGPALTKVADKTIDGVGAFFGAICMPAAEEFGLLLRDRVTTFRAENLQAIAAKTQRKMKELAIEPSGDANPLIVKAVIEDASWSDDETIQEMWAGLLAVASGESAGADDSMIYTDTIKRLTPFQARFIELVYADPRLCTTNVLACPPPRKALGTENPQSYEFDEILRLYPGDLSKFVPIAQTHEQLLNNSTHPTMGPRVASASLHHQRLGLGPSDDSLA